MPWKVFEKNGKHCLYKINADGEPSGEAIHCHDTHAEAMAQMRALYASEAKAVKFVDGTEDTIEGLLMPWGGVHNGKDLDGEYFSTKTDFCLEWFPAPATRPLLYDHGLDAEAGSTVVGRINAIEVKSDGGWMQAQLDKQSKYFAAIKEMVEKGKLYLSSGAMAHLVQKSGSGELLRWPVVEGSLTPTPCNLLATVGLADVAKHYKSIGAEVPESLKLSSGGMPDMADDQHAHPIEKKPAGASKMMSKAEMRTMAGEMAKEMSVEMSDDEMDAMMAKMPAEMEADAAREKMRGMMRGMRKSADLLDYIETTEFGNVPLADQAEGLQIIAASLFERTKDLNCRRIKEGRVLSSSNRKRLRESIAGMRKAMDEMCAWLDSTEPMPEGKTADVMLRLELLRLQASELLN